MRIGKNKLPLIIGVEAFEGDSFGVTLESGHTILLELSGRIHEPSFAELIEKGVFNKPQTDGERLYWPGGFSLNTAEIFDMLFWKTDLRKKQEPI